jgi:hypothetical protein
LSHIREELVGHHRHKPGTIDAAEMCPAHSKLMGNLGNWRLLCVGACEVNHWSARVISDALEIGLQEVAKSAAAGQASHSPVTLLGKRNNPRVSREVKLAQRVGIVDDAQRMGDVRKPIVEDSAVQTVPLGLAGATVRRLSIN